ncbi:hypothetical protein JW960_10505 [candidate division KSB1 bacterium]|nr:hypothetical protein [candidate division KSB1 bacterium]
MWHILKADFRYHFKILLLPCALFLTGIIVNIIKRWSGPDSNILGMKIILVTMSPLAVYFIYLNRYQENRNRLWVLLPISIRRIATIRLSLVWIIWSAFMLILWGASFSIRPYPEDLLIWDMLSAIGFILIINSFPYLIMDLKVAFLSKYTHRILMLIYILMLIVFYYSFFIFTNNLKVANLFQIPAAFNEYLIHSLSTAGVALILLLLGIGSSIGTIVAFQKRKIYQSRKYLCGN